MPLFDYLCRKCRHKYEEIVSNTEDSTAGVCPKCGAHGSERQIVRFRVGGRGDLRESTDLHGCHPAESEHSHSSDGED